ncbi:MAG: Gfo/Idh/MocA family oxidoreductase [Verrucomicrobia subdivision 3 bacterium]|nr:Gfo/Idh/MocA family oxidoreductase [Limisphaerales bacterium]
MRKLSRRHFVFTTAAASAGLLASSCKSADSSPESTRKQISPDQKLNIGIIGAGGKGMENINGVSGENIVALCDVDENRAAEAFKKLPTARRYKDFRKMLEIEKGLDAVIVTTPDHTHAVAAVMAMKLGLHVYCEKPLTHSIHEARLMRDLAARNKLATQMGNQGHSFDSTRRVVEIVQSGAIGDAAEVHVWTDRPIWPQGVKRPSDTPPLPAGIDWDLWLGPAPHRPYHPDYMPFKWRGWWDFGTGALGDMGCHNMDTAYWALNLGLPTAVQAESSGGNAETYPQWSIIRYEFPPRDGLPAAKLTWYDGGKLPARELFEGAQLQKDELPKNGTLMIGAKGKILLPDWNANNFQLLPKDKFVDFTGPAPSIPRAESHYKEWITACKSGSPAMSNFDYAARLTETALLGNLALRCGKRIEWDPKAMKAGGCPEADAFIKPEYRAGWSL